MFGRIGVAARILLAIDTLTQKWQTSIRWERTASGSRRILTHACTKVTSWWEIRDIGGARQGRFELNTLTTSALDTWELAQTCQTFNESRTEWKRDYKKFSEGDMKANLTTWGRGFVLLGFQTGCLHHDESKREQLRAS